MCIPVHSPWLPGYIDVQIVLVILTMAGLFLDRPHVSESAHFSLLHSYYHPLSPRWLQDTPSALTSFKSILITGTRVLLLKWKFKTFWGFPSDSEWKIKALTMATKLHQGPASFLIFTFSSQALNFMQFLCMSESVPSSGESPRGGHQILEGLKISPKLKKYCLEEACHLKIQF